ncbi:MAG: Gfo/Idh/MocA family oxidoreductase [Armatimonadetes bacterium]|nr:Gfo/Idh/MocA family oxidoreductase [Armatimonadota bacterium]MDE2206119.1 Gfo/Idh/MocA family oxidoreductase [Armatimonadota bacterium]
MAAEAAAPVSVALVGCATGWPLWGAALRVNRALNVTAVMDGDDFAARTAARGLRKPAIHHTVTDLLAGDKPVSAALVALPPAERGVAIARLIERGMHVLAEAPIAATLGEAEALCRDAEAQGVLLMPAFTRRFEPDINELAAMAREDRAREQQARCEWWLPTDRDRDTTGDLQPEWPDWRDVWRSAALQAADVGRMLLGDAESVSADLDEPKDSGPGKGRSMQAHLIVRHRHGTGVQHIGTTPGVHTLERYTLVCQGSRLQIDISPWRDTGDAEGEALERHTRMLTHFAAAVSGAETAEVTCRDAVAAQEIVEAARISSRDHIKTALPLFPIDPARGGGGQEAETDEPARI